MSDACDVITDKNDVADQSYWRAYVGRFLTLSSCIISRWCIPQQSHYHIDFITQNLLPQCYCLPKYVGGGIFVSAARSNLFIYARDVQ